MSYILNALKKAENTGFDGENIKIKKQILVLKRRSRNRKLKVLTLATVLLGTLLFGGWLGSMQKPRPENRVELEKNDNLLDNKKNVPVRHEPLLVKNTLVPPAGNIREIQPNANMHPGVDGKNSVKGESEMNAINPPIPVRRMKQQDKTEAVATVQQISDTVEEKDIEEPLQSYSELPFMVKQKLPPLKISLHFYNSTPARRLARINGKILHESDSIDNKLTVEEITPTSVILNYDDNLFELNAPGG